MAKRPPKREGRNPKLPKNLVAKKGGWVGENAKFNRDDVMKFASRHGLQEKVEQLHSMLLHASDSISTAAQNHFEEPPSHIWKSSFRELSLALGKVLELLGLPEDPVRSGWHRHDTPVLERATFAAHRGLFNAREDRLPDRNCPEFDLGHELLDLGLDSNSVIKVIEEAPNSIRALQIAAKLAAIDPMPTKTKKHETFARSIIIIYQALTDKRAGLDNAFQAFLKDAADLFCHRIESADAAKCMTRQALEELAKESTGTHYH